MSFELPAVWQGTYWNSDRPRWWNPDAGVVDVRAAGLTWIGPGDAALTRAVQSVAEFKCLRREHRKGGSWVQNAGYLVPDRAARAARIDVLTRRWATSVVDDPASAASRTVTAGLWLGSGWQRRGDRLAREFADAGVDDLAEVLAYECSVLRWKESVAKLDRRTARRVVDAGLSVPAVRFNDLLGQLRDAGFQDLAEQIEIRVAFDVLAA